MEKFKSNVKTSFEKKESELSSKISNLKVDNEKIYELAKANTKLVLNTVGHSIVGISIVNLVISMGAPLLLIIPAGIMLIKTYQHAKKTNDEINSVKKLYK